MKIPKPVQERRRAVRIDERLPFKIGHAGYESEALTVNVSANGALCWIEKDFPLMTQFKVALSLPTGQKTAPRFKVVSMKGVLVRKEKDTRSRHFLVALYFSSISPADRRYLQKFIEDRSSSNA